MFDNIGSKIKTLAQVVCWIGIIACIITGIVLMATDEELILAGVLTAVVGSLLSWVSSFVLYGFGQLVENSDIIVKNNPKFDAKKKSINTQSDTLTFNSLELKKEIGTCQLCASPNVEITNCKIVDSMGTRYRKICLDCISKHNASPTDK